MKINSVLGPIDTADLGQTLMHEHVSCVDWSLRMNFEDSFFHYEEIKELAVRLFKEAREHGVTTMVDGTPINLGRDIRLIRDVAEESGMNVIASTGFYYQFLPNIAKRSPNQIKSLLLRECTEGINGTGILPGIFKAGVEEPGITDYNRKLLHITGEAAGESGLPVFCHTCPALKLGDEALDLLLETGLAPNRIIIGHSGDSGDVDYLESLLEKGVWLGMDRFDPPCEFFATFEVRTKTVAELCRRGWAHRLFLAHDASVHLGFYDYWGKHKESIREKSPGKFSFIHRKALPELLRLGVSQEDIDRMLIHNPRNFFEGN